MKRIVVVYGTLKKGFHNHCVMGSSKLLGDFVTPPNYTMYSHGGFPVVAVGGDTPITTEVYLVENERDSRNINSLEGYSGVPNHPNNWYNVHAIETPYGMGEMFVMKNEDCERRLPKVKTGIWE